MLPQDCCTPFLEWRICCVAGHCVRHRQIPQTGIPRRVHQVPKRPLRHVLCLLRASRLRQIGACSRQGVDGLLCACHTIHPEVATLVLRPDTSRAAARRQGCPSGFRTQDFCNHLYLLFSITFFLSLFLFTASLICFYLLSNNMMERLKL